MSLLSFKREQASPNDGQLAKTIIDSLRPQQTYTLPSFNINNIYCENGYIGNMPVNVLVDSGAAVSVIHYNLVRDMQLANTSGGAVGANGSPLDVVGQTTVTITLGYFTIKHNFVVVRNLTVDCLLGADFMNDFLLLSSNNLCCVRLHVLSTLYGHRKTWEFLQGQENFLWEPLMCQVQPIQSCLLNQ